jgi:hypothetical protein
MRALQVQNRKSFAPNNEEREEKDEERKKDSNRKRLINREHDG